MDVKKAEFFPRLLAALIDGVIGWVVVIIPVIGAILCSIYILLKDGIMYQITKDEAWKNKSIGKKLMNLEVRRLESEETVDLAVSAKRNIPLTIGSFIAIIPILGWILGGIVGFIFGLIELILVLTDENNRRLGDRWANTQVYQVGKSNLLNNQSKQDNDIDS